MVYGDSGFFQPRQVDANVARYLNVIGEKETEEAIQKGFITEQRSGKLEEEKMELRMNPGTILIKM